MSSPPSPIIHPIFEPTTCTWQYILACPLTLHALIIDPVLDYNPNTHTLSTTSADHLLSLVSSKNYTITHILETHAHADHLTASYYLKQRLSLLQSTTVPKICIGHRISTVQATFAPKFNIPASETSNVFDILFQDNQTFSLGSLEVEVLYLPGHTPDHVGYKVGDNVFTGDSIFNPDVGSARCDFPGGDPGLLWGSMKRLLALSEETKLWTGHDYPPAERGEAEKPYTTVKEQREKNKHVKDGTMEVDFVKWRRERDGGLGEPRLLWEALQVNVRGGRVPGNGGLVVRVKGEGDILEVLGGGE